MARLRINFMLEALIAFHGFIAFALAVSYTAQLWHAMVLPDDPSDINLVHIPAKFPMMAMYCIAPLMTIVLALIDMYFYHRDLLGPSYALAVASVMSACWLTVAVVWGHCQDQAYHNKENNIGPRQNGFCYQTHLFHDNNHGYPLGVSEVLGLVTAAYSTFILAAYLVYLVYAAYVVHRALQDEPERIGDDDDELFRVWGFS